MGGRCVANGLAPPIPQREMRGRRGSLLLLVMTRCVQWDYPGPVEVRKVFSNPSPVSIIHACWLESRVPCFLRPEFPVVENGGELYPVQWHEILWLRICYPARCAFSVESVAWETACVNLKAKIRRIACGWMYRRWRSHTSGEGEVTKRGNGRACMQF